MSRMGDWLRALGRVLVLVLLATAFTWLLRSAVQLGGTSGEQGTPSIVSTPQPTWTPPLDWDLTATAVALTPFEPPEASTTPAGPTPAPLETFPPGAPTETPAPPTAMATPLPPRPDLISLPESSNATEASGILFYTSRQGKEGLTIRAINLDGSQERVIIPGEYHPSTAWLRFSPDGKRIVYSHFAEMEEPLTDNAIYVINADGTDNRLLVSPATSYASDEFYPVAPFWSPTGDEVAFFRFQTLPRSAEEIEVQLWSINVDDGSQRLIVDLAKERNVTLTDVPVSVLWLADGYIYFITGYFELFTVNPMTGQVTKLLDGVRPWKFYISRDGDKMVRQSGVPSEAIQSAGLQPISGPDDAVWSSNLDQAAYFVDGQDDPSLGGGIWIWKSGTEQRKLLVSNADASPLKWSPDAGFLAFLTAQGIHVADTKTGNTWLLVPNPGYNSDPPAREVFFVDWVPVPK